MDAVRWHSFSTPLSEIAPINISTAGQPSPQNSLYRVQSTHAHCCFLLHQAHQQGMIQLDITDSWRIISPPATLAELAWEDVNASKLTQLLQSTPEVLQRSAAEIALHLLYQHIEAISNTCHQWCVHLKPTGQDCILLLATKQVIFDLLENILHIKAPNPVMTSTVLE
jgi:arginyl-tRNA synthetase